MCSGVPIKKNSQTTPLDWTTHNMSLWEDVILLSSDADHQPLLMINQTGVYTAPDIEKMENETLTNFQILKVMLLTTIFIHFILSSTILETDYNLFSVFLSTRIET